MNRALSTALVALVTFCLVIALMLFLQSRKTATPEFDTTTVGTSQGNPWERAGANPRSAAQRDPGNTFSSMPKAQVAQGFGALEVIATLPSGGTPGVLIAELFPPQASLENAENGFLCPKLEAGTYQVRVSGGDIIPQKKFEVLIREGQKTSIAFALLRGVRPKGKLLTALEKSPIPDAVITFGGQLKLKTDADGHFASPRLIHRSALETVEVSAAQYDDQRYRGERYPDPNNMVLYLGGGPGQIDGEIVNLSGEATPKEYLVRLAIGPLYRTRREFKVDQLGVFRVENLYASKYRIEVSTADGSFPVHHAFAEISAESPRANLKIELIRGLTVAGKFIGPDEFLRGLAIELKDIRGHFRGRFEAQEGHRFRIPNLLPGRYYPHLHLGKQTFPIGEIRVEANQVGVQEIDVDVLRHKLIRKK